MKDERERNEGREERRLLKVGRGGNRAYVKKDRRRVGLKLKETTHRNRQIIAPSQLRNLPHIPEARPHHDCLVPILFIIVEDALHALDAWVLVRRKLALLRRLVPVHDAANKRRDEESACLGGGNGLHEGEHQGQIAGDAVFGLQDVRGLDAFPGRGDLDEDALFADVDGFVHLLRKERGELVKGNLDGGGRDLLRRESS